MTAAALLRRLRTRVVGRRLPEGAFIENRREAIRLVAHAEKAVAQGNLDEAESLALDAMLAAPGWPASLSLLGRVLDRQGRAELAMSCHRGHVPDDVWFTRFPRRDTPQSDPAQLARTQVTARERIDMPAPGGIAPAAPGLFDRRHVLTAETFVDTLPGGQLWQDAHDTLVLDRHRQLVTDHTRGNPNVVLELMSRHVPRHYPGRVFVIGARGCGNYYHWMTDVLPKLELCRRAGLEFRPDDRFVIPTRRADFQIDSLAALGINEAQLHVSQRDSPYLTADELIVPYLHNALATTMGAWLPDFLKRTFVPDEVVANSRRRLFVSRDPARSQGRGLENLAEVNAFFAAHDFMIVFPERHSLGEQARLFAEADVVAGPHGAGLANIVFCTAGTRVIEFYGAHLAPCYRAISALTGLDYHAHYCLDSAPQHDEIAQARTLAARRTAGFSIDLDQAAQVLENAGITLAEPDRAVAFR